MFHTSPGSNACSDDARSNDARKDAVRSHGLPNPPPPGVLIFKTSPGAIT